MQSYTGHVTRKRQETFTHLDNTQPRKFDYTTYVSKIKDNFGNARTSPTKTAMKASQTWYI